jgi:hypothetical protein
MIRLVRGLRKKRVSAAPASSHATLTRAMTIVSTTSFSATSTASRPGSSVKPE